MPRLSLYRPNKQNDYKFIDNIVREQYTVGGIDIFVHKYLGPKPGGDGSTAAPDSLQDATQPVYDQSNPLFVEDLFLLENRNRKYDDDVFVIRGVFNVSDIDFDLTQFGLFLNNDTLFITFHYNDMIDIFGRKLMNGDVIEIPNLKDYHPLDMSSPKALPKLYVIQDAAFASEGFSQTWLPHLWRIKAIPLVGAQEYQDVLDQYADEDNPDAGTLADYLQTHNKELEINDAILTQAERDVPVSGYDVSKFYVTNVDPTSPDGAALDADGHPVSDGWLQGYLTGNDSPPNGLPATSATSFPAVAEIGDYVLRTDYNPNRLFRFDGTKWVKVEDHVRTSLSSGPDNHTQRNEFVSNTDTVTTTDRGEVESRQSLSDLLDPDADN